MPVAAPARSLTVAVIGNPNTGKSTLFTALTGVHSRIGNFPGVTVEKKVGWLDHAGQRIQLVDLPGTYSLSPRTLDEQVSVDVLLGRQADVGAIDAVLCIVDAGNLERNLYVVSQVLDLGLPLVLVLNMWDLAAQRGIQIDAAALSQRLGVPVIACEAHRRRGVTEIAPALMTAAAQGRRASTRPFPPVFYEEVQRLQSTLTAAGQAEWPEYLVERLLLDPGGQAENDLAHRGLSAIQQDVTAARGRLKEAGCRIPAIEAKVRYAWARQLLQGIVTVPTTRPVTMTDRIDRVLTHKVAGLLFFALLMFGIFQALFAGAEPLMGAVESVQDAIGSAISAAIPPGPLRSLLVSGLVAGVGGVLVFLPQIVLLFLFIAILEDCGYMARAAFLMDKLMTKVGLSGKSFVPLMSSFACAIPGIMATRVIENRRDRMTTILVAPLMSCSARLPVYALLIAAFIPEIALGGWLPLHGTVLFAMVALGAVVAIPVAWLLKKTLFRGETPPFVMELPSYKWPSPRIVLARVYDSARAFVVRAGTLIFATNVIVWALAYFPGDHRPADQLLAQIEAAGEDADASLQEQYNALNQSLLEQSYIGRMGRFIEPAIRPAGWDWRIGIGVIASFPAREVIVATLGTIYSLGSDVKAEDTSLHSALQTATWPDGRPVYTIPVALSLMVFFALCAQCASTLMVIRRETNHIGWAVFTFVYMTTLAYVAAVVTYQVGTWMS